jgi:glycosyltransferase involved in cell wall biosynthesis
MTEPKVSIIMPVYNNAAFIGQAIASIIAQTFLDWELIVIDDGSKDDSGNIADRLAEKDSRIRVIRSGINQGLTASLNLGLKEARAEIIARLDSDDYWVDNSKLEKQFQFLAQRDYALVGTEGMAVDESGKPLFKMEFAHTDEQIRKEILRHNCFIHSSVMFRKAAALSYNGYKNSEGYVEDYELWLELGLTHKFAVLPLLAVHYRINSTGLTYSNTIPQWQAFINLMKRFRKNYPNFYPAYFKLLSQKLFLQIFGFKNLNILKKLLLNRN